MLPNNYVWVQVIMRSYEHICLALSPFHHAKIRQLSGQVKILVFCPDHRGHLARGGVSMAGRVGTGRLSLLDTRLSSSDGKFGGDFIIVLDRVKP